MRSRLMGETISGTLNLDSIQSLVQVSEGKAIQLMETCIWCLSHCDHSNGIRLKVIDREEPYSYIVTWPDERIDMEAVRRSYNRDDAIGDGAEAMAFLISVERTFYTAVERAVTRTGIDYWLGFKERNPNEPFHRAGRLEISGIMTENPSNSVSSRIKEKLRQTIPTDHTFPVY